MFHVEQTKRYPGQGHKLPKEKFMITTNLAIKIEEATKPPTNNYEAYRLALFLVQCVEQKYVSPDKDMVEKTYETLYDLRNKMTFDELTSAFHETLVLLDELKKEAM